MSDASAGALAECDVMFAVVMGVGRGWILYLDFNRSYPTMYKFCLHKFCSVCMHLHSYYILSTTLFAGDNSLLIVAV